MYYRCQNRKEDFVLFSKSEERIATFHKHGMFNLISLEVISRQNKDNSELFPKHKNKNMFYIINLTAFDLHFLSLHTFETNIYIGAKYKHTQC